MKTVIAFCFSWLLVLGSTSFGAVVVNSGFEDAPDFNGWVTEGLTSIETSAFGINPTDPTRQALLRTGDGGVGTTGASLADLATALSIATTDITAVAPNAFNGSAISQSIAGISAGDTLTFDWNFLTSEGAANPQDTAFFSISRVGGTPQTFFLANPANATTPFAVGDFSRQTTYNSLTPYQFTEAGSYVLGFGVVNLTDRFGPSGLLIDKVTLTAVPEPTALAGLGLLGLTLTIRRRRRG